MCTRVNDAWEDKESEGWSESKGEEEKREKEQLVAWWCRESNISGEWEVEIVAGLLRHPSPISIDGSEACETFPYVFKTRGERCTFGSAPTELTVRRHTVWSPVIAAFDPYQHLDARTIAWRRHQHLVVSFFPLSW
jgi:hypothetical protein